MEQLVEFYSEKQRVVGRFQCPVKGAPCVLMSHGFESSMDGGKWVTFPLWFFKRGYATLKFNYRGCGEGEAKSEGKFQDTTLTARLKDYHAALDFLEGTGVDMNRIGSVGSSFGGMIVLASGDERVKAIVSLATPCEFPSLLARLPQPLPLPHKTAGCMGMIFGVLHIGQNWGGASIMTSKGTSHS